MHHQSLFPVEPTSGCDQNIHSAASNPFLFDEPVCRKRRELCILHVLSDFHPKMTCKPEEGVLKGIDNRVNSTINCPAMQSASEGSDFWQVWEQRDKS